MDEDPRTLSGPLEAVTERRGSLGSKGLGAQAQERGTESVVSGPALLHSPAWVETEERTLPVAPAHGDGHPHPPHRLSVQPTSASTASPSSAPDQVHIHLNPEEEKGPTEDKMVGRHHQHDGHEFEQAPGVVDGQGGLACCSPWGRKESDTTEPLN